MTFLSLNILPGLPDFNVKENLFAEKFLYLCNRLHNVKSPRGWGADLNLLHLNFKRSRTAKFKSE